MRKSLAAAKLVATPVRDAPVQRAVNNLQPMPPKPTTPPPPSPTAPTPTRPTPDPASPAATDRSEASSGHPPFRYTAALANDIETRWQRQWETLGTFRGPNPGEPGFDAARPKFYVLDMFPYPSGAGLHVGHPEGYTATDIVSRFKAMRGFNVLHPMGFDAFGLPAEQYALQTGVHPDITTRKAIENFRRQLKRLGFSYDWSRELATIDPGFYRWTQWIFLKLYDAWFDHRAGAGRARPIVELLDALRAGAVAPRINPAAAEHTADDKSRTWPAWDRVGPADRRRIVDSYRLAYMARTTVNWCPKLGTVLANDEVIDGRSERGGHPVFRRSMMQWTFRITAYADRLLSQLESLDWPASTRTMQREWIGRSEGAEIDFAIPGRQPLRVFTTRPDTIFGATSMVVAPEHPLVDSLLPHASGAVREYVRQSRARSDVDRMESKAKTGVDLGIHALNPATNRPIPVWCADYVLMGYGTGAIMAVPAHDERDHAFATQFGLPIVRVVDRQQQGPGAIVNDTAYPGEGVACNSAGNEVSIDGLATPQAKRAIIDWLERSGRGARRINHKLRDWTFSRQRYWGEPFPIVFDEAGNHYPISTSKLPVLLPELADYAPVESDEPSPLLAKLTTWVWTTAGEAGVDPELLPQATRVRRETSTMPGSAGSSWYAIRYCDARNAERFVGNQPERYWMGGERPGVDLYLGGSEHAVGHLLYARFWQNVLFDLGEVSTPEPFRKLFHQGLITAFAYERPDKTLCPNDEVSEVSEGVFVERATGTRLTPIIAKMSKSLKNVVNPDDVIAQHGADTMRLYEMYMGPLEASKPWNPRDISGCFRFLQRLWRVCVDENTGTLRLADHPGADLEKLLHRTTAKVADDIERLSFNTAIAAMIELVNAATSAQASVTSGHDPASTPPGVLHASQVRRLALILAPFAPHLAEELWSKLDPTGRSIAHEPWPAVDSALLVDDHIELAVQVNGKVRARITVPADASEEQARSAALADPSVQAAIAGKPVRKVVVVPGRLVSVVV